MLPVLLCLLRLHFQLGLATPSYPCLQQPLILVLPYTGLSLSLSWPNSPHSGPPHPHSHHLVFLITFSLCQHQQPIRPYRSWYPLLFVTGSRRCPLLQRGVFGGQRWLGRCVVVVNVGENNHDDPLLIQFRLLPKLT